MSNLKALLDTIPQQGQIEWIGLRPTRRAPLVSVEKVTTTPEDGLIGDHYGGKSGKRQVTLIQAEHLPVVAGLTKLDEVSPLLLRRNLVVSGLNLLGLIGKQFQIGDVLLEGTSPCHPCSRMEQNLGEGGYQAMRGHGGICARILAGGQICVGDIVRIANSTSEISTMTK